MKNRHTDILIVMLVLTFMHFFFLLWFYETNRYLPPPFVNDKENTFMDFFNTLYWSSKDDIYTQWKSVYPPLSFIFLQIFDSLFIHDASGMMDGFEIRQLFGKSIFPLLLIFIISLFISIRISFKHILELKIQAILFVIFAFSIPFLFALERGNLIVLCLPVLSWFIFTKNQVCKSIAFSILVNLKPYFAILFIIQLLNLKSIKENKDFLFLGPVISLIVYFVSGLMLNQEFYLMPLNLLGFATNSAILGPTEALTFPSTIISFTYHKALLTGINISSIFSYLCKLAVFFYLLRIIFLIIKHKVNLDNLSIFAIIFLTNYSVSTGGYATLFYIPILAILYSQRDYMLMSLIFISMFIGLWDVIPIYKYSGSTMNVYLSGEEANVAPYVSLGAFIRPIANFATLVLFFNRLKKRVT